MALRTIESHRFVDRATFEIARRIRKSLECTAIPCLRHNTRENQGSLTIPSFLATWMLDTEKWTYETNMCYTMTDHVLLKCPVTSTEILRSPHHDIASIVWDGCIFHYR